LWCDKNLSAQEIKNLSVTIHGNFIRADEKNYLSSLEGIALIEKHFGELVTNAADSFECLKKFKNFMREHYQLFTPEIKSKLWEVINSLALSTGGKNKNELIVLNEISLLFK
jgi:hypothetical protein